MTADTLAVALELDPAGDGNVATRLGKAASILRDLRRRRLIAKAFQPQRSYPGDPLIADQDQKEGRIDFREVLNQPADMEAFRSRLIAEEVRMRDALGMPPRTLVDQEGAMPVRSIATTPGGTQRETKRHPRTRDDVGALRPGAV